VPATGRFRPHSGVLVLDADGLPVRPGSGVAGQVAIAGSIPLGYYQDDAKTSQTFRQIGSTRYSLPGDWATVEAHKQAIREKHPELEQLYETLAAATAAIAQIPGVDQVVRKLSELQYERALRQMLLANAVKIGPQQLPELWTVYERAGETLDLPELPDLYTTYFPLGPNAVAVGAGRPIVVVSSQFVEMLDPDEHWALFGHELGHVLADHVLYTTTLAILLQLQGVLPFLIRLPYSAVLAVLLAWSS